MAASLIALLACFLVFGRLRRRTRLNELMLACALAVFALSNLLLVTVPIVAGWAPDDLTVWAAPTARSLGGLLFVLAAFVPSRRLRRSRLIVGAGALGVATMLLLVTVLIHTFARQLPSQVTLPWSPRCPRDPTCIPVCHSSLCNSRWRCFTAWQRLGSCGVPGGLATSSAAGSPSPAVLAAASHVNYLLYPATNSQFLAVGDLFRFAFYAVLLVGSMREIWSYWHALSRAAVLEERQRIACDLHDGVAQELAYLARNLYALSGTVDEECLGRLRRAVERAQLESRRAISAMAAPSGQPFEVALAEAVTEVAERYHVELDLDLTCGIQLSASRREALVRIACEAVTNAARHSGVSKVNLGLEREGSGVRLRVSDKGHGFDTAVPGSGGFGLTSMRERAHSVGGELLVTSAPGRGSQVEVAV